MVNKMDEYINKTKLIDAMRAYQFDKEKDGFGIMVLIGIQPTIEVVPVKHGTWIEGKTLEKCSVCGKKGFPDWNYCPRCGAIMDLEE